MHQTLIIVDEDYTVNQRRCWMVWKANSGGKSFDFVHMIPL